MNNPYSLKGKTILVTGASSGIGKRIAIRSSEMGASVVVTGRNEERLAGTLSLLDDKHSHQKIAWDLSETDTVKDFVSQLPELDGIVMDAAIFDTTVARHLKLDKMRSMFNTNTFANIALVQALLKQKKLKNGASVVFISSVASTRPYKGNALYSATKGAINSFSKVLAVELGAQKIRVNCIHPGIVRAEVDPGDWAVTQDQLSQEEARYPLGFGEADDIAYAAVYLLSDVAKWVTGSDMIVDGGQSII
jgi:NAD(P)-dependent dehydrogenase (short-subunit alcohol dehydrogenase family)